MLAVPPVSTHHVVEVGEEGRVTGVREVRELMQWENGGYFVYRPGIFDELREGEDMVPHAFARLLGQGGLFAHRYTGFWRAADTFKDRAEWRRCPTGDDARGAVEPSGRSDLIWDPAGAGASDPPRRMRRGRALVAVADPMPAALAVQRRL